ncbi:MAG: lamin tail domain-containing protein [Candidatus Eisenbacteria bacterium]|nr:lamin tail domain-containing protein [Candidatus Eisenbacteria bacterium]
MKLHKSVIVLMMVLVLGLALSLPALAQQAKGGHDETSEVNNPRWANGAPTPGVAPALTAVHLLISEFAVAGSEREFAEIYNPTSEPVDLSKYYLTDALYTTGGIFSYYSYPSGTYQITTNTDFCSRFPAGASIAPGAAIVVALYGPGIDSVYGAGTADYEVTFASPTIPDMINVGNNLPVISAGATTLTNGSEFLMLFFWDGISDNVCDVDYVTWGSATTTSRVDKTGLSCDGPDIDVIATVYNNDTASALQSSVTAPAAPNSSARVLLPEGVEAANGNGCIAGGPTAVTTSTWGQIKTLYR